MRKILKLINFNKLLKLKRKQRIKLVTGILVILLPIVYFTLINPRRAEAAWWNDNWHYRIKTIISNAGSTQTDFQISISLDTATAITNSKMQSDCDDIRITNSEGAIINDPYWIENCNDSATLIWVKLASIPTTNQIYYVYYGNETANSKASAGGDVFQYFEDFDGFADGTDITQVASGWTKNVDYSSTYTVVDEKLQMDHLGSAPNEAQDGAVYSLGTEITNDFAVDYDITIANSDNWDFMFIAADGGWTDFGGALGETAFWSAITNEDWQGYSGSWASIMSGLTVGTTYKFSTTYDIASDLVKTYVDDTYKNDRTFSDLTTTGLKTLAFGNYGYSTIDSTWKVDNIRVRKFAPSNAPASTEASEEVGPNPVAHWKFDEASDKETSPQIQKLEQQIEILNKAFTHSGSRGPTDNSLGMVSWDADKYSDATVYFEADFRLSSGIWGVNTYLYDESGNFVSGSTVSTSSTTIARVRSSAITLTDDTNYTIRMDGDHSGSNRQITAARLIIVQNSTDKITDTEAQIDVGSNESSTNTSYTQLTNGKIYNYDSSQFSPAPTSYFEANLRTEQPTIEQQINILDQYYSTTSHESYVPTDNSMGIVRWDADKYAGATVYFEVISKPTGGTGSRQAVAGLYSTGGTQVTTVWSGGSTLYGRHRSAAITLTDDTDYTVRFTKWGSTTSAQFLAARLIVVQTDTTKITDTSTQIEVGDAQTGFTNESYALLTDSKIYQYDQDQFSPTPESSGDVEFHASVKIDDSGDSVYVDLYNITDGTSVSGSEISHTGDTNWTLKTVLNVDSDTFWDTTNDDEYAVRVRCNDDNTGGCSGNIANARLVLDQTAAGGITDVEVVQTQVNTLNTDADSTYTDQNFLTYYSDSPGSGDTFAGGVFTFFYEATMKTSAGTGYAQLKNDTSGAAISNSEIGTTSPSYVRLRSSDISSNMPASNTLGTSQNLDTQIKNAATDTTSVSSSSVIVQVSSLATAPLTAYADLYNLTDGTEVSGSEVTSTSISWDIQRSSAITLTTGKDYVVRLKSTTSNVAIHSGNAKVVQDQSDTVNGFTKTELVYSQVNYTSTDTDDTYSDQDFLNLYDPATLPGTSYLSFFYEATIKTDAGTGYAQLRNDSDGSTISNSEIGTTSPSYVRVRSGDIISNVPTASKNLDTQLKNSAASGNTTTASGSWSIVQIDKATPRTAFDSSVFSHNGKVTGPSWTPGCKFDFCLDFDGTDDYVVVDDATPLDFAAASDFTIGGWFKHASTSGTDVFLVKYESGGSDGGYKVYMESDGAITFGIDDDNTSFPEDSATTVADYDDNAWHYLAAVKDGTTSIAIYIDGVLITTDSTISATGTLVNNDGIYIGIDGDESSNPFDGLIDEVKIYPYARSAAEIRTDYIQSVADHGGSSVLGTSDASILSDKLVGHFKMDEISADSCSGGEDSCDSSGYGNHADWGGNTTFAGGKFGNAITLDGTTDNAVLVSSTGFPFGGPAKKQTITITNTDASVLTDYQVALSITYDADMNSDFSDLRFYNSSGTELNYWLEEKTDSTSATIWVKVDSIPANDSTTIDMYYGHSSKTSLSSPSSTFVADSIEHFTGDCSGGCSNLDNHPEADTLRADTSVTSTNTVATINDGSGGDNFFRRYRFLFLSDTTGTHNFGTNSDDGSEATIFPGDGYGGGYNTTHPFGAHTVVATWYGGHGTGTCGTSGSPGSSAITSGDAVWIDYLMTEASGGQYAQMCIREPGGSYQVVSTANFANQIFARNYTSGTEPSSAFGAESSENSYPNEDTSTTIAAWIYADTLDATQRNIVTRGTSPSIGWYFGNSAASPGKLIYSADGDTNTQTSNKTLSTGSWYHVALAVTKNVVALYIDGEYDSETTNSSGLSSVGNVSIGGEEDGAASWAGDIDEVRIYSKTLSPAEIRRLYNWAPGPVGYWPMDENTGTTTIYDKSANGNDGTLTSMTESSWVVGKFGSALEFDGSADYANVGTGDTLNIIGTDVSVSAWIKTSSTSGTIFAKVNTDSPYNGYALSVGGSADDGKLAFCYGANSCAWDYSTSTVNDGAWHHVEVIFDSTQTKFYIDGVLDITVAKSGTVDLDANGKSAVIGYNNITSDRYFNGAIDDVRIYNYTRTPGQIVEDMNAGHPIGGSPISSMMGYWSFDKQSGQSVYDSGFAGNNGTRGADSSASTDDPTWKLEADCKINACLSFDGGDAVVIDNESDYDFDLTDSFSVSAWVWQNDTAVDHPIVSNLDGAARGWQLGLFDPVSTADSNGINFYLISSWSADAMSVWAEDGKMTANQWHHVAVSYDGSTDASGVKIYHNGISVSTTIHLDSLTGTTVNASPINIGKRPGSGSWHNGKLDEVKIYNDVITPAQVLVDMTAGSSAAFGSVLGSSEASDLSGGAGNPPIGYWPMDENTGTTTTYDKSGNEYDAAIEASMTESDWVTGVHGSALAFDGSDDDLTVTHATAFDFGTSTDFTFETWVKLTGTADVNQYILDAKTDVTGGFRVLYNAGSDSIKAVLRGVGVNCAKQGATDIQDGKWHHLVVVFNRSSTCISNVDIVVYIDGKLETMSDNNATSNMDENVDVGGIEFSEGGNTLNGELDEVKLYNYARTGAQARYSFDRGRPIGWWQLDECQGATAYDASLDGSGNSNGNTGTIGIGSTGPNTSLGTCGSGTSTEAWNNGTTGKINYSFDFDGVDDSITVTNASEIDFDTSLKNGTTFATWIYANSDGENDTGEIFDKGTTTFCRTDSESGGSLDLQCSLDLIAAGSDATLNISSALSTNTWHHVAMTYSDDGDDEITVYVDGISRGSSTDGSGGPETTDTNDLIIGGDSSNNFDGQIDDFRIYNYELSVTQIKTIMNDSAQRFGPTTGSP